jgi:glycosyltransferase involved in cell wall biosynthesis
VTFEDFRHVVDLRPVGKDRLVLGYVGAVDNWFDQSLVKGLHDQLTDWEIHIVGPLRVDTTMLSSLPRVKFFGRVPYDELPRYLAQFDVAMIPFVINPLIEATSPIKLFEYLAAGVPVVSTPMPEVLPFVEDGVVGCASSSDEWASVIRALRVNSNQTRCQEIGHANSWSTIFEQALAASQS